MCGRIVAGLLVISSLLAAAPAVHASEPVVLPGLDVLSFQVNFHIEDAVGVTHLALLVKNPAESARETVLTLPLSEDAVLTGLALTTHNQTLVGVVAERAAASTAYEVSKERGEDAVLLESAGKGLLSLRLNAAAGATLRLDAVYAEMLPLELGVREYVFPASRIQAPFAEVGHYRVNATIVSSVPWSDIEATGVPKAVVESSDHSASWLYDVEDATISQDLVVRITPVLSGYQSSMALSGKENEGVFAATILPPEVGEALPVDVVFVLDHSGSMSGEKMRQAKAALETILGQLHAKDRFGIVIFDDSVEKYRSSPLSVSGGNIDAAQDWVGRVEAEGSTNIEGGLSAALEILGGEERAALPMIVLITDGLPTAGITEHRSIIESIDEKNDLGARVHVVGIGFDQDNAFLAELAGSQRGFYDAMDPAGDVEAELEGFYAEIASPLLKDITVDFVGLDALDVHPDPFPDLYRGSELVVAGRANTSALPSVIKVILRGSSSTGAFSREILIDTPTIPIRPEVEALWARQKANSMERYIQLHPSLNLSTQRAALLAHGLRYQIETLQTSWVIVPLGQEVNTSANAFEDTRSAFDESHAGPVGASAPGSGRQSAADQGGAGGIVATTGMTTGAAVMPDNAATSSSPRTPAPGLVFGIVAVVGAALFVARRRKDPS